MCKRGQSEPRQEGGRLDRVPGPIPSPIKDQVGPQPAQPNGQGGDEKARTCLSDHAVKQSCVVMPNGRDGGRCNGEAEGVCQKHQGWMDHHQIGLEQRAKFPRQGSWKGRSEGFQMCCKQHQQSGKASKQRHPAFCHRIGLAFHGTAPPPRKGSGEPCPEQQGARSCRPCSGHAVEQRHVAAT